VIVAIAGGRHFDDTAADRIVDGCVVRHVRTIGVDVFGRLSALASRLRQATTIAAKAVTSADVVTTAAGRRVVLKVAASIAAKREPRCATAHASVTLLICQTVNIASATVVGIVLQIDTGGTTQRLADRARITNTIDARHAATAIGHAVTTVMRIGVEVHAGFSAQVGAGPAVRYAFAAGTHLPTAAHCIAIAAVVFIGGEVSAAIVASGGSVLTGQDAVAAQTQLVARAGVATRAAIVFALGQIGAPVVARDESASAVGHAGACVTHFTGGAFHTACAAIVWVVQDIHAAFTTSLRACAAHRGALAFNALTTVGAGCVTATAMFGIFGHQRADITAQLRAGIAAISGVIERPATVVASGFPLEPSQFGATNRPLIAMQVCKREEHTQCGEQCASRCVGNVHSVNHVCSPVRRSVVDTPTFERAGHRTQQGLHSCKSRQVSNRFVLDYCGKGRADRGSVAVTIARDIVTMTPAIHVTTTDNRQHCRAVVAAVALAPISVLPRRASDVRRGRNDTSRQRASAHLSAQIELIIRQNDLIARNGVFAIGRDTLGHAAFSKAGLAIAPRDRINQRI
jgi:hypothetical protein